ncbi:metal-dependent phosphohydrolase [Companilactobacillus sp. RD055328]|uniref:HD domain-containing protein n=1 Tax=Companilactobacillus sp. RD055328 TaxID=2916634 RepID=UPI001FC8BA77|nr:HD domain-containing protein [Companilactobacillus sp. RD055328]GKQ43203.1 metal-dependent phosphohydrolase [Companilactobacillus sp. RD055328]
MNKQIIKYRNEILNSDQTGHSIDHINRVVKLAEKILTTEPNANMEVTLIAANVHDVIDEKIVDDVQQARKNLREFLQTQRIKDVEIEQVFFIIDNMSYSKNLEQKIDLPIEGQIVQDADRLDAIGAIGIGRAFYYGGSKGGEMYNPNDKPRTELNHDEYRKSSSVINHFYEKLLLLKDQMNTTEGRRLAQIRHKFMEEFITEFKSEY